MKSPLLAGLFAACLPVTAQQSGFVTNYYIAHPDFRIVNGQLYNTAQSRLWKWWGRGTYEKAVPGGIIIQTWEKEVTSAPAGPTYGFLPPTKPVAVREVRDREIFVRNFPITATNHYGDQILCRVMEIGTTNIDGKILAAFDYGTPNIVPVIRTTPP